VVKLNPNSRFQTEAMLVYVGRFCPYVIVTCLWSEWLSSSGDGQLMWLQTWGHCLCMFVY